jgi:UTP--glucose-1-phosphate uridylyltransferase
MEYILEKMPLGQNPSNMAQFGRFVFTYGVIEEANKTPTGKGNELWIADILCSMAKRGELVIAQPIEGEWLTTGDPLHFLQTTLKFALDREDLRDDMRAYMKELLK